VLNLEQISILTQIPTFLVLGDLVEDVPSLPTMWKERFELCGKFVQQVNTAGADATRGLMAGHATPEAT
jgi:hypothetical protein